MNFEAYLDSLKDKTVAVIGIGVSNRPLIDLLRARGIAVTACDKKSREALGAAGDELEAAGVGADLIRLSCGLENTADLIADHICNKG